MLGRAIKSTIDAAKHRKMKNAMLQKDMSTIHKLLATHQADADYLNYSYDEMGTLLAFAMRERKADLVIRLLRLKYTSLPSLSVTPEIVNARDERGELYLEWAIDNSGTSDVIELLAMPCFDLDMLDRVGNPLLFSIVRRQFVDDGTHVLRAYFKRADVDPSLAGKDDTVLAVAVRYCKELDFMKMLLADKRISVATVSSVSKTSPLAEAVIRKAATDIALLLLEQDGIDILQTDSIDRSPLSLACEHDNQIVVGRMLQRFGKSLACAHPQVIKALEAARDRGNVNICRFFIDYRLNTHVNVLRLFNQREHGEVIAQILGQKDFHPYRKFQENDADNKKVEYNYVTYSMAWENVKLLPKLIDKLTYVQATPQEHLQTLWEMARYLRSDNALFACFGSLINTFYLDINAPDENGDTALHHAAREGNVNFISHVTFHFSFHSNSHIKLDTNIKNGKGEMPLHTAILHHRDEATRKLMTALAIDINACTEPDKKTALMLLLENKLALKNRANKQAHNEQNSTNNSLIHDLLEREALDLRIKDANQRSIIFYALDTEDYDLVKKLLEKCPALLHDKDENGNSVLHHLVRMEDNIEHLKALIALGGNMRAVNQQGDNLYNVALVAGHQNVANYLFHIAPELVAAKAPAIEVLGMGKGV